MLFRVFGCCVLALAAGACSFPDYAFQSAPQSAARAELCNAEQTSGNKTGVDCGGLCPPCGAGQGCADAADCASKVCSGGICQQARCQDLVQNGDETAVDCGGVCEAKCEVGRECRSPYDCRTNVCAETCQAASCADGVHNGDESAIDCGGACDPCVNGQSCQQASDCRSGSCFHNICVSAGCTDQLKNGDETGVDCGGSCAPCADNASCKANADCLSFVCDPKRNSCAPASCSDGVLNGTEAAIDCGLGCAGCVTGQTCKNGADCHSGLCKSDVCVPGSPNGAMLSRKGWVVTASDSDMNSPPSGAIDGDPDTRWSSGTNQGPGIWFKLDMQQPQLFFSVVLDAHLEPSDAPVIFDVFLSNDGNFGSPTEVGLRGTDITTVDFGSAQLVRYVYFRLSGVKSKWWSIHELNAFQ